MPLNDLPFGKVRIAALPGGVSPPLAAAQEKFYIEDGWVFREHHGKYIECICRSEEISSASVTFLPIRHID
jgi:hypothetical protein